MGSSSWRPLSLTAKASINVEVEEARDVKVRKFHIYFPAHLNILIKILHLRCSMFIRVFHENTFSLKKKNGGTHQASAWGLV